MPTVIDSLIVSLGLDGSAFRTETDKITADQVRVGTAATKQGRELEEGSRKAITETQKRLKQTEEIGRQSSEQFTKFRNQVAGLFATLAAGFGIQSFIRSVTETDAATGRLSKNLGMSTRELSAWQGAAQRTGGSAAGIAGSFTGLTQQFQQFALTGQSAVIPYFRALGVQMADANGEMRPMRDIMLDLADKFSKMTPQRASAFGAAIGLDQGTINLLEQGRSGVEKLLAEQEKLGTISEQDAEAAIKFDNSMKDLLQSATSLGRAIVTDLMPGMSAAIKATTEWVTANKGWLEQDIGQYIKSFVTELGQVPAMFKDWQTGAEAVLLFMVPWGLAMAAGLGPIGAAIVALIAGLALLKKTMEPMDPKNFPADSPFWKGMSKEEQLKYPDSPAAREAAGNQGVNPNPYHWWNPGSWLNQPAPGAADTTMNQTKRGFLATLSGPESGGAYDVKNGGSKFSSFAAFPEGVGAGGTSSAAGRYQITSDTWKDLQKKYGFTDFQPETQDKAAWALASDRYRTVAGGDLEKDLAAGKTQQVAQALKVTWPSLPGGSQSHQTQAAFDAALQRNTGGTYTQSAGMAADPGAQSLLERMRRWREPRGSVDPSLNYAGPGASSRAAGAPAGGGSATTSETNVNINGMTINTQAKDSDGIAKSIGDSMRRYGFVPQANYGLQ